MIYLYSPDDNRPSGGIQKIYHHADILNRNGFQAAVVHVAPGFRCTWFANDTPIVQAQTVRPGPDDILVASELFGPQITQKAPGIRKVIFNQNCYNTFLYFPLDDKTTDMPYRHPDVVATITVSEDSAQYLRYAFPEHLVLRIRPGIDRALYYPEAKKRQIAFMPRRLPDEALQVFNILKVRGALADFEIVPIDGVPRAAAARILRQSAFFFSFSAREGFGLPPAEAMACGCVTVGFHGGGGREYFLPEFSWPVAAGEIENYARTVETLLARYRQAPESLAAQTAHAAQFICDNYSDAIEEADTVACWRRITGP
jgi:glycosyltransferase involved in cell wall biosynthesis